jgi:predicted transcriptional regulator
MNKIRKTIRLHQEAGLSNRQIARALGISRPSVAQYLSDYRSSGLSYSAIAAMSDDELVGMLEGVKIELSERYQDLSERFVDIVESACHIAPKLHRSNADHPAPDLRAHLLSVSICTPSSFAGFTV